MNYKLNISNSTFKSNRAYNYGGNIYAEITNGDLIIDRCIFYNNSVSPEENTYGGAAIYTMAATNLYVSNSNFTSNYALRSEGGAVRHSGYANFENCIFDSNMAGDGGAICSGRDTSKCDVNNTIFINNFANRWGGALQEHNAVVNNSVFRNNTANLTNDVKNDEFGAYGGAVCVRESFDAYNALFEENQARRGGAIYFEKRTSIAVVQNCTFTNNSAVQYGGAITTELTGGTVTISDSKFRQNSAPDGGAIFMSTLKGTGTV